MRVGCEDSSGELLIHDEEETCAVCETFDRGPKPLGEDESAPRAAGKRGKE